MTPTHFALLLAPAADLKAQLQPIEGTRAGAPRRGSERIPTMREFSGSADPNVKWMRLSTHHGYRKLSFIFTNQINEVIISANHMLVNRTHSQ
jgi:hypothetical protein